MQRLNKTSTLLGKIAAKDITAEAALLQDKGLLELFSWHTDRSPRARLKDTLAQLASQGLVHVGSLGDERLYSVTPKGHARLGLQSIRTQVVTPTVWRQRWHFVSYQIPNDKKVARNQFLIELKRLGFQRFGPALWVSPHDFSPAVKKLAEHLQVAQFVDFLRADSISDQKAWQRRFKLP